MHRGCARRVVVFLVLSVGLPSFSSVVCFVVFCLPGRAEKSSGCARRCNEIADAVRNGALRARRISRREIPPWARFAVQQMRLKSVGGPRGTPFPFAAAAL